MRLTATPRPTLLVEVAPAETRRWGSRAWDGGLAARRLDARQPDRRAQDALLRGHGWSQRRAEAAGADHALLLDRDGRLGEAAVASVFCAVGDELMTAPADGLLAGVARAVVLEAPAVREEALDEEAWRAAEEIVRQRGARA